MPKRRFNLWKYDTGQLPHRKTLERWRKRARKLARTRGATTACDLCKRPLNRWGGLFIRHPYSYGKSRKRRTCKSCTDLVMLLVDVMEWKGASDHLPPEVFNKLKGENHRRPEEVKWKDLLDPMPGDAGYGDKT